MHAGRLSSIGFDTSTRPIGARTRIHTHIWGFFAEDGEESSVVMFGLGEKKAEVAELGSTSPVSAHGLLPMPRSTRVLSYSLKGEM